MQESHEVVPEAPAWMNPAEASVRHQASPGLLLAMVLAIATSGLVYELVMAAVASYVLGDSVRQFSTIIGLYLSALGIGAYLSRFVEDQLEIRFIDVEIAAALVGGLCAPLLFAAFSFTAAFHTALYATVLTVGVLVGLELPLLMRILRRNLSFKDLVAKALMFDYAGALLGSLGFSLLLMPGLGLVRSSIVCGILNGLVALLSTWALSPTRPLPAAFRRARLRALTSLVLLLVGLVTADRALALCEANVFGKVSVALQSPYQRIVVTENDGELSLFLNGALQFSSSDEYRYHEALVHPALARSRSRAEVLVAGGGDGLAVREILRWRDVAHITLVDLDASVTELASKHPPWVRLNGGALRDPRVEVVNADAMQWLATTSRRFDAAFLDFPDPSNYSLGKLYSRRMYRLLRAHLSPEAVVAVQATSPHATRDAFWCIITTLESAGYVVTPYRVFVPSFGDWGFALAELAPRSSASDLDLPLRYLSPSTRAALRIFPRDSSREPVRPQTLEEQKLVSYYLRSHQEFR